MIWNEKRLVENLWAIEEINRSLAEEYKFYLGRAEGIKLAIKAIEGKI